MSREKFPGLTIGIFGRTVIRGHTPYWPRFLPVLPKVSHSSQKWDSWVGHFIVLFNRFNLCCPTVPRNSEKHTGDSFRLSFVPCPSVPGKYSWANCTHQRMHGHKGTHSLPGVFMPVLSKIGPVGPNGRLMNCNVCFIGGQ